jgi:hypothetical protein
MRRLTSTTASCSHLAILAHTVALVHVVVDVEDLELGHLVDEWCASKLFAQIFTSSLLSSARRQAPSARHPLDVVDLHVVVLVIFKVFLL